MIMMISIPSVYIAAQISKAVNTSYKSHYDLTELQKVIVSLGAQIDSMEEASLYGATVERDLDYLRNLRAELTKLVQMFEK